MNTTRARPHHVGVTGMTVADVAEGVTAAAADATGATGATGAMAAGETVTVIATGADVTATAREVVKVATASRGPRRATRGTMSSVPENRTKINCPKGQHDNPR